MLDPASLYIGLLFIENIHISPSVTVNKYSRFCVCTLFRKQQHLHTMKHNVIKTQLTAHGPVYILHMFRLCASSSSGGITFYQHVKCCYVDYDWWSFICIWKFSDEVTLKCYVYCWALDILPLMDSKIADELELSHMLTKELGIYYF
jgi:hypothetical protein